MFFAKLSQPLSLTTSALYEQYFFLCKFNTLPFNSIHFYVWVRYKCSVAYHPDEYCFYAGYNLLLGIY